MKQVQATEAKTHLADLLRAVERGESFAITRHGRAVAHLVPAVGEEETRRSAVERFLAQRQLWRKVEFSTEEVLDARHDGHRA